MNKTTTIALWFVFWTVIAMIWMWQIARGNAFAVLPLIVFAIIGGRDLRNRMLS